MDLFSVFLSLLATLVGIHLVLRFLSFRRGPPFPRLSPPRPLWTDPAFLDSISPYFKEKGKSEKKGLKVGITGGSGFLGRYLCRALLERGHTLVLLDLLPPSSEFSEEINSKYRNDVMAYHKINLTDSSEENELYLSRCLLDVDVLIHAAGVVNMAYYAYNLLYNVHVGGTTIAINAALRAKVSNFIYISSAAVIFSLSKDTPNMTEVSLSLSLSSLFFSFFLFLLFTSLSLSLSLSFLLNNFPSLFPFL